MESRADSMKTSLSNFNALLDSMQQKNLKGSGVWERTNQNIAEMENGIREVEAEMQKLIRAGKQYKHISEVSKMPEYLKVSSDLASAMATQEADSLKYKELAGSVSAMKYERLAGTAQKVFSTISKAVNKANSLVDSFGKKLWQVARKVLPSVRKEANKTSKTINQFGARMKSLLQGLLVFNVISAGFRKLFQGISEGFSNFYQNNESFKKAVDGMNASLSNLGNNFAAAFAPVIQIAIPYIEKLISYLNTAVSALAQFVAALFGKSTYTTAVKTLDDITDAAGDTEKAVSKALSPLDKLNVISSSKESKTGTTGAGNVLYEEVPVDSYFNNIAEKLKDIAKQFFKPLKTAWERQGKKVMDAWEKALKSVWNLIVSIGKDFLEVWNQEETIKIFENLLLIIADIGLIISNLADRFREAWEENDTGLHILENIRDVIAIIVDYFRQAADFTVKWANNLNFSPLLEAFETLTDKLSESGGLVDSLSGILYDFYTMVLLPLGQWVLEKGLPDLLDTLTNIVDAVDWEKLRNNFADLWKSVEPFAEKVGEGLILFIEDIGIKLANFVNSEEFENFLDKISEWMDEVTPEDVAKALGDIADAVVKLKVALLGFKALSAVASVFTAIKSFLEFFGVGGAGAIAATNIEKVGTALDKLRSGLIGTGAFGLGLEGLDIFKQNKELAEEMNNAPKYEDYDFGNPEQRKQFNEDLKEHKERLDAIANSKYDTSSLDNLIYKLSGYEIPRDENGNMLWLSDLVNGIDRTLLKSNFITAGQNVALGIAEGLEEEDMTSSANTFYNNTDTAIKGAFGIHSPAENMKPIGENILLGVVEGFTGAFDCIATAIENLKTVFQNKFIAIKTTVLNIVSNIVSGVVSKINAALSLFDLFDKKSSLIGIGKNILTSIAYNLETPDIPGYATGQVIPTTMQKHLAWLGDNKQETEVVSPLSTMKQAMLEALRESGISGGGSDSGDIVIEIDGNEVFRVIRKQNQEFRKQNGGKSAFA